jgi:hypothetical protein
MDSFAAGGRVERAVLRRARAGVDDAWFEPGPATEPPPKASELVEVHAAEPLGDRLATFRDRWSELTFYLFDPQSWR